MVDEDGADVDYKFAAWVEGAEKHVTKLGLRPDVWKDIYGEQSDWAFILKIDSLIETVCRGILYRSLKLEIRGKPIGGDVLVPFIDSLPIRGRASVSRLLKASGCPDDHIQFVEAVRDLRNAYAHRIAMAEVDLLSVLNERNDKSHLLKVFSWMDPSIHDEKALVEMLKEEPGFLRFCILREALRFLSLAYLVFDREKDAAPAKA